MNCSVTKYLKIAPACPADYKHLGRFHYRSGRLGPCAGMYKLIDTHPRGSSLEPVVGIIIYSMPTAAVELRNVATCGLFSSLSRTSSLELINNNVRTISRVVIEPRYRGLGLAHRLVRETMGLMKKPYIEALAVMGKVNPFFEKAGMIKYIGTEPARSVRLKQALSVIGIEESNLVDVDFVDTRLTQARGKAAEFVEDNIKKFLTPYGRRARNMPPGKERTETIISKLSDRCAYYLWRNTELKIKI